MPKYFITFLRADGTSSCDGDGEDYATLAGAQKLAEASGRELLAEDIRFASSNPLQAVTITNNTGKELKRITAKEMLPKALR